MRRSSFMRRLRESFTARVIIQLTVAMVVMAAVFDVVLIRMQQARVREGMINDGTALTRMLARSVRLGMFSEDREELAAQTGMVFSRPDITGVFLFTPEGHLLFRETGKGAAAGEKVECCEKVREEIGRTGSAVRRAGDAFVFYQPVFFAGTEGAEEDLYFETETAVQEDTGKEVIGYAALRMSTDRLKRETAAIVYRTGAAVALFLILSIIAIFAVTHRLTRPLKELLGNVRRHGGRTRGGDIEVLLTTYGNLLRELEEAFATINAYKENLENQVAERTRELEERSRSLQTANERQKLIMDELAAAQDQLVQSEKMAAMGRLVAGVAHEINNTVNFVSGALPSLKREIADVRRLLERYRELEGLEDRAAADGLAETASFRKEIDMDEVLATIDLLISNMEEGTERTARIVSDLRVFSHNGGEQGEQVDLHAVLDSALTFIDKDLKDGVEIRREYGDIPPVFCRKGRISQVFLNMLTNGLHAMAGRGTMTLRTRRDGDRVHVSFIDTGCGIAGEDMARIFEPFFTRKEVGQGSGLGLGISYSIVRQHGGDIRVESEEGRGSVFEVILPVAGSSAPKPETGGEGLDSTGEEGV